MKFNRTCLQNLVEFPAADV